ncbi:amidase domain-containing protein [Microterricola viridarii]|uniref:IPT/TIG domain-containing protein n=1 Tax=Microterricola viridarii TaxID=412690 RepID=A0A109QXJ6_9MICO|nr:amidase domain-containing protein [Microterricola viridarii]AMB59749.1 hypothetical protein AWU67_13765 [Microterricola viridarii]
MLHRLPSPLSISSQRWTLASGAAGLAAAACGLLALSLGVAPVTADSASATEPAAHAAAQAAPAQAPANTVTALPAIAKRPVALAAPVASGPVTGGTVVTVSGEELNQVSAVQVGGVPAVVVEATPTALSYQAPVSTELVTGTVPVELFDASGAAVPTTDQAALDQAAADEKAAAVQAAAIAADPHPLAAAPVAVARPAAEYGSAELRGLVLKPGALPITPAAAPASAPALLSFEYLPDPRVTAQTDYLLQHWSNYNLDYTPIYDNDCANFTSQGLIARGWQMDESWNYSNGAGSAAWISSTAFQHYMEAHPERGTALGDDQRASVKVGDIAQFDWDGSGDRDHTSTVTRVDKTAAGVTIYVAGHSKDSDYWNVDEAISGGGSVYYWSLS